MTTKEYTKPFCATSHHPDDIANYDPSTAFSQENIEKAKKYMLENLKDVREGMSFNFSEGRWEPIRR